jgi:hypothetical protein
MRHDIYTGHTGQELQSGTQKAQLQANAVRSIDID